MPRLPQLFFVDGGIHLKHLPATVPGRSDSLCKHEHLKWFLWRSPCILPYNNSLANDYDSIRSPSFIVRESSPPLASPSSTRIAIEKEIQLESRLVLEFGLYVRQAQKETFADGTDSIFAERVHESVRKHGATAVAAWERTLRNTNNAFETGEELLRQLGNLVHTPYHRARLRTLTDFITYPDPRIRDAAGLGLSSLDDPSALPKLQEAYSQEREGWLRQNLKLVIEQLESTRWRDF